MTSSRFFRPALYALLIFAAGVITGAFVAPIVGRSFMRPPGSQEMAQHIMHRLSSNLDLTDAQVAQIKPLVEKTGADMETIRRETTQRVMRRMEQTNTEISAILLPEQQAKFKTMEEERRKRMERDHRFAEPPPPPPNR
ncbi:MAG TPA: Spy/CpxP family protein refolding chaperone [Chthoniobacterales bacterium]|jgi:Spy/CpxP family protein refolding chaperone